jgi:hypothetical protein
VAVGFTPAVRGSAWPKSVRVAVKGSCEGEMREDFSEVESQVSSLQAMQDESQQQPNNKTRSKASANQAEIQMSAGCTRLQQRNYNEPATMQPAAEAELTLGAERTKTNWPTHGAQTSPGRMRSRASVQNAMQDERKRAETR